MDAVEVESGSRQRSSPKLCSTELLNYDRNSIMNIDPILAELRKQRTLLKDQLARAEKAIEVLSGLSLGAAGKPAGKKRKMSAAARAKIAAYQRARWAKINAAKKKG